MAISFSTTVRNNGLNQISAAIDAGPAPGLVRIYDGVRPAAGAAVTTQNLLAELAFADPAFPAATSGTLTANPIVNDSSANATGTATWFRVVDSTGAFVFDGDCGTSGSDLNLNSVEITTGVTVSISSFQFNAGNA